MWRRQYGGPAATGEEAGAIREQYRRHRLTGQRRESLRLPLGRGEPRRTHRMRVSGSAQGEGDNIFITVSATRARAEAKKAQAPLRESAQPLSPLDGVPIAWKDLFDVAGTPTTAAPSSSAAGRPRRRILPCVANAAAAGMVVGGQGQSQRVSPIPALGPQLPHFGTPVNSQRPQDAALAGRLLLG